MAALKDLEAIKNSTLLQIDEQVEKEKEEERRRKNREKKLRKKKRKALEEDTKQNDEVEDDVVVVAVAAEAASRSQENDNLKVDTDAESSTGSPKRSDDGVGDVGVETAQSSKFERGQESVAGKEDIVEKTEGEEMDERANDSGVTDNQKFEELLGSIRVQGGRRKSISYLDMILETYNIVTKVVVDISTLKSDVSTLKSDMSALHNEASLQFEASCIPTVQKIVERWKLSVRGGPFSRKFQIKGGDFHGICLQFNNVVKLLLPAAKFNEPTRYTSSSLSLQLKSENLSIQPDLTVETYDEALGDELESPTGSTTKGYIANGVVVVECSRSVNMPPSLQGRTVRDEMPGEVAVLVAKLLQLEKYVICANHYYGVGKCVGAILMSRSFRGIRKDELDRLATNCFQYYPELGSLNHLHQKGRFALAFDLYE
ncbi:hypothetical protein HDU97_009622 [Phlyctochytrium planicorne]|nr:hypothetical protein HDU97_009622 [Phlyctochytrium planicorne]